MSETSAYTQAYNRYSYVVNNPLKYTDPTGWLKYLNIDDDWRSTSYVTWYGNEWEEPGRGNGGGGLKNTGWISTTYTLTKENPKDAGISGYVGGETVPGDYLGSATVMTPYTYYTFTMPDYSGAGNVAAPTGEMTAMGGVNINSQENQSSRPKFSTFKKNYPGSLSAGDVYKLIGGKVYQNYQSDPEKYANSCALRLSRALNYSGVKIPYIAGQTGSGSDKNWYFYRVNDLKNYLIKIWGKPDLSGDQSKLQGKTGVILFQDCGWSNATGHLDVWNGSSCEHECYFGVCGQASLWTLP